MSVACVSTSVDTGPVSVSSIALPASGSSIAEFATYSTTTTPDENSSVSTISIPVSVSTERCTPVAPAPGADAWATESNGYWLTETGDNWILESAP